MAVALQSQGTLAENTSAATTINVPYPATLDSNSIMILGVSVGGASLATLPAGWTQIARFSNTGSTLSPSILVAIKQATGSESGNLAVTTPNVVSLGQILAFSSVDTTTPQDVTASTLDQTTNTTTPAIPGVTIATTDAALIYFAALNSTAATATPPTSPGTFTETADRTAGTRGATMGYLTGVASGATGTVTITWSGTGKTSAALVALRPSAGTTPVTATLATTWNTKAAVSQTLATTWNTKAAVSQTLATTWNTKAAVSKTLATTWNVATVTTKTLATTWNTAAAVTATLATTWNVAGVLTSVTATLATTWNVVGRITATTATTWNTRAAITQTLATTWDTKASVAKTVATSWNTIGRINATTATTWNVAGAVTKTLATTWNTKAAVAKTLATTWNVRAQVTATSAQVWDVYPLVTVTHAFAGAPTDAGFVVTSKLVGATSVRLAVSTSAGMTSPSYVAAQTPDANGRVRHVATGLAANTQYYYQPADTGASGLSEVLLPVAGASGTVGKAKTLSAAGSPANFTVALGSCYQSSSDDPVAMDNMRAWAPDFQVHVGDMFYNGSASSTDADVHAAKWDTAIALSSHALRNAIRDVPMYYVTSDGETLTDNGDSNNAWTEANIAGYKKVVPYGTLADTRNPTVGRYQTWVVGRVRFIMLDVKNTDRSPGSNTDNSSKTMLGATQLAWFKARLSDSEPLKVVISDVGWMGAADIANGPDKWWSYDTERQDIITYISTNSVNVDWWHGDTHQIAVATKAKNTWGGFPIVCGSPYASPSGGRNLSTFSSKYADAGGSSRQYMRITFTDDGTLITRTASGWDAISDTEKVSQIDTWSTLAQVTKTVATTWNTRAAATATTATTWNTKAAVAKTVATTWNTKAAITKAVATTWNTRAQSTQTISTTWNTRATIAPSTTSTTWGVRQQLVSQTATQWAVRAQVEASITTTWDVTSGTVITPTPLERTLRITAEARTSQVPAPDRTMEVAR